MNDKQLKELLDSLTLREKIGQMFQGFSGMIGEDGILTGNYDRNDYKEEYLHSMGSMLGISGKEKLARIQREHLKHSKIPMLFMLDIIYGFREIFPISLALACSFDPEMVEKTARISASESVTEGINVTFSPMVDISRDARWGRCAEGYGEDPLLSSRCAAAMVRGYQGDSLADEDTVVACVKHFAAYGATCDGKDYNSVEMSERKLRGEYLPSYKAAVDAGVRMLMTSFNTINGVPTSVNKFLMQDVLRNEWGFDGVAISDWGSIGGCMSDGAANSGEELAVRAAECETDIDMCDPIYVKHLEDAVNSGKLSEEVIDRCVMRILRLKNDIGILDDPYKYLDASKEDTNDYAQNYEFAKKAVCESSVLLKNDGILPLDKSAKVAVIGPFAEEKDLLGSWAIRERDENFSKLTIAEGVRSFADADVAVERGCNALRRSDIALESYVSEFEHFMPEIDEKESLEKAIAAAKNADVVILTLGECARQSGESGSRANIAVNDVQMELFRAVKAVNDHIVVVLTTGRPLDISEINEGARAVLNIWQPGSAGGEATAEMLYGVSQPSGKLSMTFPRTTGQVPIYYSCLNTGHWHEHNCGLRYLDTRISPLYPFGFGLSYTKFEYSDLVLSRNEMTAGDEIQVSVKVTNAGERDGDEIVQLYLRDCFAGGVSLPVKQLKDFRRVHIPAGETTLVNFTITEEMLKYYNVENEYVSEAGEFIAFVGSSSSDDDLLTDCFYLK
ncbi:MAG: glycoside hydrolase family 3 N-terminal domain-containing protein [Acutalibacteraceae bacterium]